jgi:hypothetical protein
MNDVNSTKGLEADVIPGIFRSPETKAPTHESNEEPAHEEALLVEGASAKQLGSTALTNSRTIEA